MRCLSVLVLAIASGWLLGGVMGCEDRRPRPLSTSQSNNKDYEVDFLFEQDGCKVYRFDDLGYSHYFTTCGAQTMSMKNCGKGCTREERIQ